MQNGVLRSETHAVIAGDARLLESIAHHLYIRCGIVVGCGDPCMPEPGLDRQKVHAGLEKLHGEEVPEDVRRYGLVGQGRPGRHGLGGRTPHDMGRSETSQALVAEEYRSRLVMGDPALAQQGCQRPQPGP